MNKYTTVLYTAAIMLCLGAPAAMASDTNPHASIETGHGVIISGDHGIHIEDGDVVIDSDHENHEARITPAGALIVDGKTVPVSDQQKIKLLQYSSTVKDIESQGMKLGMDAAGFAVGVVGDVFAALLSGEDEDSIDKEAHDRAMKFKRRALPICKDVQSLKQLQDELAAGIQSFKPFAVIEGKDADDCEHDINSDD